MLDIGRIGIWSGELRRHPDPGELAEAAAELEQLGYSALWFPGGQGGDVFGAARRLLAATRGVPVATRILHVWMHDPAGVPADRAAVEAEYPGRFLLGIGIGHPERINVDNPGRYRKPLTTMREYLDALDAADPPVPPDARMLAALRRRMLELARDRSAGAHPYFVPVEHTRVAREVLGPDSALAPEQAVVLEMDPERARARAREHTARYLELPNYTGNLELLGFTPDDFRDGGSDRLRDAVVPPGGAGAIPARARAPPDTR